MCLGIPGRLVELHVDGEPHLALAEVAGVRRRINVGLLEDEPLAQGSWVLIHVGFAMAQIDEDEAARAMEGLQLLGGDFDDEVRLIAESGSE